jgi:hypothetical protein
LHVGWLAGSQCYGEAFNSLASGIISARPAEEQVRTRCSPRTHPPERDRVSALTLPAIPCACDQARLSAEFGKLMSPEGLTKSIDRHNAMLFRTRLVDFLATVRGFMMVK